MNIKEEIKTIEKDLESTHKESHPYNKESLKSESFKNAEILIVGTFPPARFTEEGKKLGLTPDSSYDVEWFYGSKDNAFWTLLPNYQEKEHWSPKEKEYERKKFAEGNRIVFLDLFQEIQRYGISSSDKNIFPTKVIDLSWYLINQATTIKIILFTSQWVMSYAKKEYLFSNKEWLKQNGKPSTYISNNTFHFPQEREIKLYVLPSPSRANKNSGKQEQWNKIFKEIGLRQGL